MTYTQETLGAAIYEVVEFVDEKGWGQPAQLFALVPTDLILAGQPELADTLTNELTLIEQEPLPVDPENGFAEIEHVLGTTVWPSEVEGSVLIQEIVVLPPGTETDLETALEPLLTDPEAADDALRAMATAHPESRCARLIIGALRDGQTLSLLQMQPADDDDSYGPIELLSYPELATGVSAALAATLENYDDY